MTILHLSPVATSIILLTHTPSFLRWVVVLDKQDKWGMKTCLQVRPSDKKKCRGVVGQIVCWWNHGPTHPLPFAPHRAHQNKSYLGANTNNSKKSQKSENKHTRKEQQWYEETSKTNPSNISSNRRSGFSLSKTRVSLSGSKHWARFQASAEKTLFSWWFSVEDKDSDLPGDQIPGEQLQEEGGRHLKTGLWYLGESSWYFLQAPKWGKCRCRNKVSTVKRFKCLGLTRMNWKGFPLPLMMDAFKAFQINVCLRFDMANGDGQPFDGAQVQYFYHNSTVFK